ncbi:MAG: exonuclease SbcCD subunit D [Oscillospiraceae bacterium]|jgi:exonuclease SbcD|nr:exonuclease SbcCD subunit D [Oscillospiraceae bacterium]
MKFLHLADLHVGKVVNGFAMLDEQRYIFSQIVECVRVEKPDAVLIAGDVYDRPVPGADAVVLFDEFLTDLAETGVTVMLVSGNHDSPERLSFASRLLRDRRLYLCGTRSGAPLCVPLDDEYGDVCFWLMPFIKPAFLRSDADADHLHDHIHIESYFDAFDAVLSRADIDYSRRNVLVSHQFFISAGIDPLRSDSEMNPVGGLDAIDASLISGFDYAALGHLHMAQKVGKDSVRYAGSPLKYSFSEWRREKTMTMVEIRQKGDVTITALPLKPRHDMRVIKGRISDLLDESVVSQGDRYDYIHVILTDDSEIIDPMDKIRAAYPHVMSMESDNARSQAMFAAAMPEGGALAASSPYDLFSEFFLQFSGRAMSDTQSRIVRELLEAGEVQ